MFVWICVSVRRTRGGTKRDRPQSGRSIPSQRIRIDAPGQRAGVIAAAAGGRVEEAIVLAADPRLRRGGFLKAVAGGLAVAGTLWVKRPGEIATAAPGRSARQDRAILNFALLLEYLKESFYKEAVAEAALTGELKQFAEIAGDHERAHADALRQVLGPHARARPQFHFGSRTRNRQKFQATAVALEDLAVAAYNAQAANLTKEALALAIKIVSVEGRHAAWIRAVAGEEPAPTAADPGEGVAAVTAALQRLNIR